MDKITKVKDKITSLWKTHLHPNDFEKELNSYLNNNKDWTKTTLNITGTTLHVKLFEDDIDGYEIKVSLKKPPNIKLA